jgi:hypothetical protein
MIGVIVTGAGLEPVHPAVARASTGRPAAVTALMKVPADAGEFRRCLEGGCMQRVATGLDHRRLARLLAVLSGAAAAVREPGRSNVTGGVA